MKSLKEYVILEMSAFTQPEMKQMFGKASAQVADFVKYFERFLAKIKKEYSVKNKTHRGYLWNIFTSTIGSFVKADSLKQYHCDNPENLGKILGDNADLINKIIGKDYIKNDLGKLARELKEYKISDEYVPLQDYDKNDPYEDDEELGRAFCIYYQYDPGDLDYVKVYRVNGKTTDPNVKKIMNLHRMDWNIETKGGYYHGNTCTVEHYRNTGKEDLIREIDDALFDE